MTPEEVRGVIQEMAIDSGQQANKKIDSFSSLLMQIAFASVGLAGVYLETGERPSSSLVVAGVIFLVISILFGGLQMILDYKFFREDQKILQKAAYHLDGLLTEGAALASQNAIKVQVTTEKMRERPDESTIVPTCFQIALMLAGAGLVLFAFLNAL